jgi:NTE family protein
MTTLRDWLRAEPFALGMSSGFFGFFAHCGVLSVLEEERLLPSRVAGSSAGALVTGIWASGIDTPAIAEALLDLRREHFWDPAPGAGLLRGRLFRRRLDALLPTDDLARCRVPAAVSVYDLWQRRVRVLDRGPLAPALHASCAVPIMFHPVRHAGGLLVDGGVGDRPGLAGLAGAPRVLYHHLESRSPWRGALARSARAAETRARQDTSRELVTLTIDGLPRVTPFRLERGAVALETARDAMRTALDRPVSPALRIARA